MLGFFFSEAFLLIKTSEYERLLEIDSINLRFEMDFKYNTQLKYCSNPLLVYFLKCPQCSFNYDYDIVLLSRT